jgi:leucyl aminopeptidase (aminopeptidase T)
MAGLSKYKRAAKKVLKDYMGLVESETLLIIADTENRNLALDMLEVASKMCMDVYYAEMTQRERDNKGFPEPIEEMMKGVDVIVSFTNKSFIFTGARREATKLGIRIGMFYAVNEDVIVRTMPADHNRIVKLTESVAEKLQGATNIMITTEKGTELKLPVKRRKILTGTGVLRNISEFGFMPSGEVFIAPLEGRVNGKIVVDGSISTIGVLNNPVTIDIKKGLADKITGKTAAKKLIKDLEEFDQDAYMLGKFGIGTNHMARISGVPNEDKLCLGTCCIAFGNNDHMGGKIDSKSYIECVIELPTIYFDDICILEHGNLMI